MHFQLKPSTLLWRQQGNRLKEDIDALVGGDLAKIPKLDHIAMRRTVRDLLKRRRLPILDDTDPVRRDSPGNVSITQEMGRRNEMIYRIEMLFDVLPPKPETFRCQLRIASTAFFRR